MTVEAIADDFFEHGDRCCFGAQNSHSGEKECQNKSVIRVAKDVWSWSLNPLVIGILIIIVCFKSSKNETMALRTRTDDEHKSKRLQCFFSRTQLFFFFFPF